MAEPAGAARRAVETDTREQRRVLTIALALNVTMFVIGLIAGLVGQSSGLIADSLDMLADASGFVVTLAAIQRSQTFKANAALFSGVTLLTLGGGVLADAARRAFVGSEPVSFVMIGTAALSFAVNAGVLRMLGRFRDGEIHLRASWIDTRADVIANLAVIAAGVILMLTGFRYIDLIVGAAIGLYVIKEALEIIGQALKARKQAR